MSAVFKIKFPGHQEERMIRRGRAFQAHPIRWVTNKWGYRRVVTTHMHGRRVVIYKMTDNGPKSIDSALTVQRAKQIISKLAAEQRAHDKAVELEKRINPLGLERTNDAKAD